MRGFGGANKEANARIDAGVEASGRTSVRQANAGLGLLLWIAAPILIAVVCWPWGLLAVAGAGIFFAIVVIGARRDEEKRKAFMEKFHRDYLLDFEGNLTTPDESVIMGGKRVRKDWRVMVDGQWRLRDIVDGRWVIRDEVPPQ